MTRINTRLIALVCARIERAAAARVIAVTVGCTSRVTATAASAPHTSATTAKPAATDAEHKGIRVKIVVILITPSPS